MELGPESERPTKAIATPPGQPTLRVKLSDDEWREHMQRKIDHDARMVELAKTKHLRDREEEYKKDIYPYLDEAKAKELLDGDSSLKDSLKTKKDEIDARFPAPAP